MTAAAERRNRTRVNEQLYNLGRTYHDFLPIQRINEILDENGFNETEPAIYCGRNGQTLENVGQRTFLSLSWHKMDVTGRYEVVAYVS